MSERSNAPSVDQHEEGMRAARAYAGWHLGYQSWGDNLVHAYLNPQETMERLRREQAKYEREPDVR